MSRERWTAVDDYLAETVVESDPALAAALASSAESGLPAIQVSPAQGKLLALLARAVRASAILEIGTLGAYSTIWLARALAPGGRLMTLESDPKHAEVARANLARAGLADRVEVRLGNARETLPRLADEQALPFDLTFIDADKPSIPEYFDWAVRLARPGGLIVVDNVVRDGALADPANADPNVQGVRRFHATLAGDRRVSATTIQTVGSKGYDGFTLAYVIATS